MPLRLASLSPSPIAHPASLQPLPQLQARLVAEQQERQLAERLVLQREQELAQMQHEARRRETRLQEKIHHISAQLQQAEQQLKARPPANPAMWFGPVLLLLAFLLWLGKRYWLWGRSDRASRQ